MTQMGKHYGLPVYVNVGLTDSKRPDAQAGLEAAATLVMAAAAGADNYGHMGISGADQAASLDVLVLQHEVISFVESVMREIEFSDSTLGLEEIEAVAGTGKTFLDRDHTAGAFSQGTLGANFAGPAVLSGLDGRRRLEHRGALPTAEATNLTHTQAQPRCGRFGKLAR